MSHYNSYRQFIKKKFGAEVLKVSLNGGFSCPNRDGTKSSDGCFFCDNRSFSPAAVRGNAPVEQLKKTIDAVSHRFKIFIPYLQPFSNTYGTISELKAVYEPLLLVPNVVGLVIGTRPDCFSDEIFSYLADLNKRTYLSVELGLQSSHPATLQRINRGHTIDEFVVTVNRLAELNIETVVHVMLGLPGETHAMMIQTAEFLSRLPLSGVKIHQLMIIKGTEFELLYKQNEIVPIGIEEYGELLCDFLDYLRPDQLIHRIMADSKVEHGLVAPLWSADKGKSVAAIQLIMDRKKSKQASRYKERFEV